MIRDDSDGTLANAQGMRHRLLPYALHTALYHMAADADHDWTPLMQACMVCTMAVVGCCYPLGVIG